MACKVVEVSFFAPPGAIGHNDHFFVLYSIDVPYFQSLFDSTVTEKPRESFAQLFISVIPVHYNRGK